MMLKYFYMLVILFMVGTVGCGPEVGKNKTPQDPLAALKLEWTSITYMAEGTTITLTPPFATTQSFYPDTGGGSCASTEAQVIFNGTFEKSLITSLSLTGLTSQDENSGNNFRFVACMPAGAASVTITAHDFLGKAFPRPLQVSLHSTVSVRTLGVGHGRYPNTGFATINTAPKLTTLTSAGKTLANLYVGSVGSATKASTGNSGYTLDTGFANYLHQAIP